MVYTYPNVYCLEGVMRNRTAIRTDIVEIQLFEDSNLEDAAMTGVYVVKTKKTALSMHAMGLCQ